LLGQHVVGVQTQSLEQEMLVPLPVQIVLFGQSALVVQVRLQSLWATHSQNKSPSVLVTHSPAASRQECWTTWQPALVSTVELCVQVHS
jgi:hypothetical protein